MSSTLAGIKSYWRLATYCFRQVTYKINLLAFVAFKNEVIQALTIKFHEISDYHQRHLILGKFLKNISRKPGLKVEEFRNNIFFVNNDLIKSLVIKIAQ